jgi:hypothetical protein
VAQCAACASVNGVRGHHRRVSVSAGELRWRGGGCCSVFISEGPVNGNFLVTGEGREVLLNLNRTIVL